MMNMFIPSVICTILSVSFALECITDSECFVRPGEKSFAEQVIEVALNKSFSSFTILVHPGDYYATKANTSNMNFVNFKNVIIKRQRDGAAVDVKCREITNTAFNGIGFDHSADITISGLSFSRCGTITSGLFFFNTTGIHISDCSFHHNNDNGVQLLFSDNITIINCLFYFNVGLQPDDPSNVITNGTGSNRGVGLGIFAGHQTNLKVIITNCTFTSNIAYKTTDYNPSNDSRPYTFTPFGNGGAIYLKMNRVNDSYVSITNCRFYNNTAIHQGGAIVLLPVNSVNNTVDIAGCEFFGNKALGGPLRKRNETIKGTDLDGFVESINTDFSMTDFIIKLLNGDDLHSSGGYGGAIAMTIYGTSDKNMLSVKDSNFSNNVAILSSGAIGIIVPDSLTGTQGGADSNQATINNCTFVGNTVFVAGSAIGVASYARVDIASFPISIVNCTFEYNKNNVTWLGNTFPTSLITGIVVGIRFLVAFCGTNIFRSNYGGGINMNHARVTIDGKMLFYDNNKGAIGGAMRLGEVALLHLMPHTHLTFINNSALQLGGAIGAENIRGDDATLILNNFCFIQYNIGGENEYNPSEWKVNFTFTDNILSYKDGQGHTFFANNVVRCVAGQSESLNSNRSIFSTTIFSLPSLFNLENRTLFGTLVLPCENLIILCAYYSGDSNGTFLNGRQFETAPSLLIIKSDNITASPGEIFNLYLYAEDENRNTKDAIYSYQKNPLENPSSVIEVHLDSTDENLISFASVSRTNLKLQRSLFVTHEKQLQKCDVNYRNSNSFVSSFTLNLIDSSRGGIVNKATVTVNVQCCHVGYEYNNDTGKCMFMYDQRSNDILRPDASQAHIYIRSDRYGGFDSDGYFITARMPPSYQNCTQEGRLPGCLVEDDDLDQQCNQRRTGFLCGKCPKSDNHGTALNLIECRSCGAWDVIVFVIVCILIVVTSLLIILCNVRLPNALKGFLFYIQVVGYVYNIGTRNGELQWHFYLSRVFGFSLFLPLCISSNLDALEVATIGFVSPILIIATVATYVTLAPYFPHLSKRKTVDGIWFLILIAYVYTADTCLNILRCAQVYEPTEFKGTLVYYYDGTLKCFTGQHLLYGVIAILVSILILIPFTSFVLAINFNLINKAGPLKDVINSGVDNKCPWWSGYDLVRRLSFFIVYILLEAFYSDCTQFALMFMAVLMLVITSRVQPYTHKWVGVIEALILLDLIIISIDNKQFKSEDFAVILLVLPFIYFLIFSVIKILSFLRKKYIRNVKEKETDHKTTRMFKKVVLKPRHAFQHLKTTLTSTTDANLEELSLSIPVANYYAEYRDELDDYVTVND